MDKSRVRLPKLEQPMYFLLFASLLALSLCNNNIALLSNSNNMKSLNQDSNLQLKQETTYDDLIPHGPIYIDGNQRFKKKANDEGWVGTGTKEDPYIIEKYNISYEMNTAITIRNVDLHFIIRDCLLTRTQMEALYFRKVKNVIIDNNVITNNTGRGISVYGCIRLTFTDNIVTNNMRAGFYLDNLFSSEITHNEITFNKKSSIYLQVCTNNNISHNIISHNGESGIKLFSTSLSTIVENTITNNIEFGIYMIDSDDNTVRDNTIRHNDKTGLFIQSLISTSDHNQVVSNLIENNAEHGILLEGTLSRGSTKYTTRTVITKNTIQNNHLDGIHLASANRNNLTYNNIVEHNEYGAFLLNSSYSFLGYNNFIDNNPDGSSQAFEGGIESTKNVFEGNYWSDWSGIDRDNDGFIEEPYTIAGTIPNRDWNPAQTSHKIEDLNLPNLTPIELFFGGILLTEVIIVLILIIHIRKKKSK